MVDGEPRWPRGFAGRLRGGPARLRVRHHEPRPHTSLASPGCEISFSSGSTSPVDPPGRRWRYVGPRGGRRPPGASRCLRRGALDRRGDRAHAPPLARPPPGRPASSRSRARRGRSRPWRSCPGAPGPRPVRVSPRPTASSPISDQEYPVRDRRVLPGRTPVRRATRRRRRHRARVSHRRSRRVVVGAPAEGSADQPARVPRRPP